MAENIKVNVNVDDNGSTAKVNKQAAQLRDNLAAAAKSASEVRTPGALAAAKAGLASSGGGGNAFGANAAKDSNLSRGIGEQTGAAGRDFAAQAQGLGGLVHVYATFAANIFAISAAYTALSKAADTANLVRGLDQLGAASGRSLGSLAKQLTLVTDGAISMRDALTATAQASAGGLTSANILRLGTVAKQASQALGVAMPDAVSRLSRGITKLEPELLDELGILVRVDKASADYARSIGKTASQLTDFEKRQGFANAVLEQGEKKFGAIKLDANPYAKIQSSMENLAFAGLDLINRVLSPVLTLLSTSPTALAVAMAGIATVLLKQAMPALGQWRQGLVEAGKAANEAALKANILRKEQILANSENLFPQSVGASANAANELQKLQDMSKASAATKRAAAIDVNTAGAAEIAQLKLAAQLKRDSSDKAFNSTKSLSQATLAAHHEEIAQINKTILAIEGKIVAEKAFNAALNETAKTGLAAYLSQEAARDRITNKIQAKARTSSILGDVASNLPVDGLAKSFSNLYGAIGNARQGLDAAGVKFTDGEKKMTAFAAASTAARGSIAILTTGVTTLAASLGNVFAVIGIVVVLFQGLDMWLSTSSKQAEAFSNSMEILAGSVDNAGKTIDAIRAKSIEDVLSAESIQAKANAFGDLSDALTKASLDFNRLQAAQSWWDKSWDAIKDGFGAGSADKLATNISNSIVESLRLVSEGPARDAAKNTLSSLFGGKVDVTSPKELEKALRGLTDTEIAIKAGQISKALLDISRSANNAAASVTATKVSFVEINKTLNDIATSLKLTDSFAKLGAEAITAGAAFGNALKDPTNALVVLSETVKDIGVLSLLPPKTVEDLLAAKAAIVNTTTDLGSYSEALAKAREEQIKLNAEAAKNTRVIAGRVQEGTDPRAARARDEGLANIAALEKAVDKAKTARDNLVDAFAQTINTQLFEAGATKLAQSLKGALEEGGIIAARGYLSVIKGAGGQTATQEGALRAQEINLQITAIKQSFDLIKTIADNTLKIEKNTLASQLATNAADAASASEERRTRALKELPELLKTQATLNSKERLLATPGQQGFSAYKAAGTSGNAGDLAAAQQLGGYFQSLIGQQGQLAKLYGSLAANAIQSRAAVLSEKVGIENKATTTETAGLSTRSSDLAQQQAALGFYSKEIADKKNLLDLEILRNNALIETRNNTLAIEQLQLAVGKGGDQKLLQQDIAKAEKKRYDDLQRYIETYQTTVNAQQLSELTGLEAIAVKNRDIASTKLGFENELAKQQLAVQEAQLGYLTQIGALDDTSAIRRKEAIELAKQELDYTKQVADAKKASADALGAIDVKIAAAGPSSAGAASLQTERASLVANQTLQLAGITAANEAKKTSIELTAKAAAALADETTRMNTLVSVTQSLGAAFGQVGTNIGTMIEKIQSLADSDTNYLVKRNALEEERNSILSKTNDDPAEKAKQTEKVNKDIAKLDQKNTQDQLSNIGNIASATKSMFKEKTFAYKAFDAVEKAIHIAKLAMWIKEAIVSATTTTTVVGANAIKSSSNALTAITAAFAAPFPIGFVTGAAMIAIMASLLGKSFSGGKSGVPTSGFSAEEQQKVQGTGQSYDAKGNLINNGGGVMGDNTAIAKSIDNSISLIESHTFKDLEYSNKMLDSLKAIKDNTQGLSQALIQAGITDPTKLAAQQGIQTGVLVGPAVKQYDAAKYASMIFGADSGIGRAIGRISTSIFGGKVTSDITDAGISIKGTLDALTKGAANLVTQYTNLQITTSGGWFSSDDVENRTIVGKLDSSITGYIQGAFQGIQETVLAASDALGKNKGTTLAITKALDETIKISTLGLKPEEIAAAITAQLSVAFNLAAQAAFPELLQFQKLGEEFGNTIVRLARDVQLTDLAMTSIGKSITNLGEVAKVTATENLLKLTGGIDAFLTKTDSFKTNFLTAAEQLAPVQAAVTKEMARLGLASIDTREEFAQVVKSLDLTQPAAQQLYADLLNVSDAFAQVHEETRKVLTVSELTKAQNTQQITILQLLGRQSEALALSRQNELDALDPALVAGQKYIYQLQDATAATKAQSALLAALGYASEALQIDRKLELRTLTDADKAVKKQIYAAQDKAKTDALLNTLLEASGNAAGALAFKRQLEINALSDSDAAIQTRIYKLQDEAALTAKIKVAYTAETAAIAATITALKSSIKTLKDYRTALTTGASSVLTPQQKYEETKAQAIQVAAIAASTAITDAQKAEKQSAIDALPAATDAFLAASQIIYASSDNYTKDFNTVLDLIDSTGVLLSSQQTAAEHQSAALDASVSSLNVIEAATQTTAELLAQMFTLQSSMNAADVAAAAASAAQAASGVYSNPADILKQVSTGVTDLFAALVAQVNSPTAGVTVPTVIDEMKGFNDPTPGMMTAQSANSTSVVLATQNAMLVAQVQILNDQIVGLRADQQQQTLHMLQMQQDVTNQLIAAQKAAADAQAANDAWMARNTAPYEFNGGGY